jgi:diacylglycerol kinase (ATP)
VRNKFLGTGTPGYHPLRKLRTVASGLRYAVVYDFSVAWKLAVSGPILVAALFLRDWLDGLLILVVTALVLVAEMFNSAIEALCDFVESGHNEKIAVIKDIAAAAVGLAMFAWLLVLGFEVEEMLRLIMLELPQGDYRKLIPAGLVITGGGANLPGIAELGQKLTRMPVRIGYPVKLSGVAESLDNPAYATAVGLLLWKLRNHDIEAPAVKKHGAQNLLGRMLRVLK